MQKNLVLHSLGHATLVVLYVSVVAWIMINGERWFKPEDTVLTPIALLLLFVLSATVVGALVLGKPALLYLNGQKSEAVKFFGYTVAWLVVATVIFILLNLK